MADFLVISTTYLSIDIWEVCYKLSPKLCLSSDQIAIPNRLRMIVNLHEIISIIIFRIRTPNSEVINFETWEVDAITINRSRLNFILHLMAQMPTHFSECEVFNIWYIQFPHLSTYLHIEVNSANLIYSDVLNADEPILCRNLGNTSSLELLLLSPYINMIYLGTWYYFGRKSSLVNWYQ